MPFRPIGLLTSRIQYEEFEEVLATTVPDFISELGGKSSLFVGASLITALSMAIGFARLLVTWLKRIQHGILDSTTMRLRD